MNNLITLTITALIAACSFLQSDAFSAATRLNPSYTSFISIPTAVSASATRCNFAVHSGQGRLMARSSMSMNAAEKTCKLHAFKAAGQLTFNCNCTCIDIMIKPDGVQRRVIGDIISRFEAKGFLLKGLKLTTPTVETLQEHYQDLKAKAFFPKLISYMSSGGSKHDIL